MSATITWTGNLFTALLNAHRCDKSRIRGKKYARYISLELLDKDGDNGYAFGEHFIADKIMKHTLRPSKSEMVQVVVDWGSGKYHAPDPGFFAVSINEAGELQIELIFYPEDTVRGWVVRDMQKIVKWLEENH